MIIIEREHDTFEVTTKPNGESRCWLETGTEQVVKDEFSNSHVKWIRSEIRYPHYDGRLDVKRSFNGECVYWKISVALDYPLAIRLVSRGPIVRTSSLDTTQRTLWMPSRGLLTGF